MKKISILSLHLGYGGIEKSVVALANLLCENHDVEIMSIYQLYDESPFNINEKVKVNYLNEKMKPQPEEFKRALKQFRLIKAFILGMKSIKTLWKKKHNTIKYIKNSDADILISTRDFLNEYVGLYAKENVQKIGWEHNHHQGNDFYSNKIVMSARYLDYLVLVSKDLDKFYKEKLLKYHTKTMFIPNILDDMPKKSAPLTEKRLVSVGRLSKEKGYMDLLRIYNLIHKDYPDWKLDIVGDGNERKSLEEYIDKHKLNDYVTLHGFQNKDYIDQLLNKSSIYVMTSFTESFGIVLIEAMSHGVPCIAFDCAEGAKELIHSGNNGYLIKNRSNIAMINKIEDLMKNKKERLKVGKNSREYVEKFTGKNVVKYWNKIIEKK